MPGVSQSIICILQVFAHLVHIAVLLCIRSSIFVIGEIIEASEIKEFAEGHMACESGL